jgi:nocardicin N-oxygenase
VETVQLGEVTVHAGEGVLVSLLDANRDEWVLVELAGTDRRRAPHLTFGHGPHRCPGAPLARLQVQIAVEGLLRRFPGLCLVDGSRSVVWKEGLITRGPSRVLVRW